MKVTMVPTQKLLNISIADSTLEELLPVMKRGIVVTPNIDHLVLLQSDEEFYRAYKEASFTLLDSQVLFLYRKLIGKAFRSKVSGADLFPTFCDYHRNDPAVKVFVLGGMDTVAQQVQKIINVRCNRKLIVGAYSPSYGFESNDAESRSIIGMVKESGATVLVIGVGAPKQEKWILKYKYLLSDVELVLCVGAALDFMTGKQKRAPRFLQTVGFEWLFRLVRDPKRLFYRYIIRDIKIFYYLLLEALKLYTDPFAGNK